MKDALANLVLIIIGWQNETWRMKKETNCARKGFIGEWCGSDLEVMKRPRHSHNMEVKMKLMMMMEKTNEVASTAMNDEWWWWPR